MDNLVSGMTNWFGIVEHVLFYDFASPSDGRIPPNIGLLFCRVSTRQPGDIFGTAFGGIIGCVAIAGGKEQWLDGSVISSAWLSSASALR
jgi:hypothetical protein